jgi:hypothetical protein
VKTMMKQDHTTRAIDGFPAAETPSHGGLPVPAGDGKDLALEHGSARLPSRRPLLKNEEGRLSLSYFERLPSLVPFPRGDGGRLGRGRAT